jgi:hypothetical protein
VNRKLAELMGSAPAVATRTCAYAGAVPLVAGPAAVAVLEDGTLIAFDRPLAFAVVERLLGSPSPSAAPDRALSDLEWDLLAGVVGPIASRGSDPSVSAFPSGQRVDVAVHTLAWGRVVTCRASAASDGRVGVSAGFRLGIEPASLRPGAVLPLGGLELRTDAGAAHAAVPGEWRGRKAVRLI